MIKVILNYFLTAHNRVFLDTIRLHTQSDIKYHNIVSRVITGLRDFPNQIIIGFNRI